MLQAIRERAQGWIAWLIVFLISVPFALWGIQSYLGVGGEPIVATVNGVEITDRDLSGRVQQARIELRERLGAAYDPALFEEGRLRDEVLNEMIQQALLLNTSNRIGMRVSDQEIRLQILSERAFQSDGRFDRETYERLLRMQGMSPAQFEAQLRQQLVGNQLLRAIVGSELVTRGEIEQFRRLSSQRRDLAYVRLDVTDFRTDEPIDEAQLQAYYTENSARFQDPEAVKLDYLVLDVAELAQDSPISDEELRRIYTEDSSRFGQAEQRRVRHLLLSLAPDADEAVTEATLQRIRALRDRILAGESFEDLAKAESQDPGSASAGGALGTIEQGLMDPAFDQVAFTLPAGELSEPVKTRFGYHLIQVTEIVPAQIKPFEEVVDELRAEVSRQRGEALFYDMGERLANVVFEAPDSLEPAAAELGLEIRHSDWISRDGDDRPEGLLAHPRVLAAAFSDEVLINRLNSDVIEPDREVQQAIVLRVSDHRAASTRPLDAVREEIVEALRLEHARESAKQAAESIAEQVRQGMAWSEAAPERTLESPGLVDRSAPEIPAEVRELAFTLPVSADGTRGIAVAELPNGDAAVVEVRSIQDGEAATPEADEGPFGESAMLAQLMGRQSYTAMLADIERRAKVERREIRASSEL